MSYFPSLELIAKRRKALGMTQHSLAKLIGVSQSMIAKMENGKAEPSYRLAAEIFQKLDELESKETMRAGDVMNRNVIMLKASDTVGKASKIAKVRGIDQFPVLMKGGMVRNIRTVDLLGAASDSRVGSLASDSLPAISSTTPLGIVEELVRLNLAVIVLKEGKIAGIITAEDLL
jgi:predicted transcriptional regulator